MESDMNNDELAKEINELESQIRTLHEKKSVLQSELNNRLSEFKPGDIVETTRGWSKKTTRRWRITEILRHDCWRAICVKKDGSDGKTSFVRDYDHPKKIAL